MKLKLCTAIAISAICSASYASDLKYVVDLGYAKAGTPNNGVWYQEPLPKKFDDDSYIYGVGLVFEDAFDNLDVSIGYRDMGRYKSKALATASDENYWAYRAGEEELWPLSTWLGKASSHGVYAKLDYNLGSFFVTYGMWYQENKFTMTIPDFLRSPGDSKFSRVTGHESGVDDIYGIGYDFGSFRVSYEEWRVRRDNTYPSIAGDMQMVVFSKRF